MALDLDDPRPPYQQVAAKLRASILTGTFNPGDKLPSQAELSEHFGVARMTIQQALRILKDEDLVISRQGSGMYVRERTARPVGLRPHLEQAFRAEEVAVDFCGYTAETLNGAMTELLDHVRTGQLSPQRITVRLLLADMRQPLAIPASVRGDEAESAQARKRMAQISERHAGSITAAVEELAELGLIKTGTVETRAYGSAPLFKAYVINNTDVFFGYYPLLRHEVRLNGTKVAITDPMGKDATLFHFATDDDPDSTGTQFVQQTAAWFESVWTTIAEPVA